MSEWKPITDMGLYDPKASEKDADVTISSSELNRLKSEAAQNSHLKLLQREVAQILDVYLDEDENRTAADAMIGVAEAMDRYCATLAQTTPEGKL